MNNNDNNFTNEIVNFIKKRNFVYERATNAIAQKIDFVFEAIIEYLNENAHEIEWESLDVSNDLLVVVARIPSRQYKQQRLLTIGIPLEIIQHQSKDKVIEFFVEAELKQKAETQEELGITDLLFGLDWNSDLEDSDVDFLDEEDENNVTKRQQTVPKRVLH